MAKGLVMQSASSLKRAHIRDDLMVLTRKFQTNDLRFYFWGRLKQQSGRALSLGLGSQTLAQIMPFWACGFLFFNTRVGEEEIFLILKVLSAGLINRHEAD